METGVLPWQGVLLLATYPAIAIAEDFYCPKGAVSSESDPWSNPLPQEILCEPKDDPGCLLESRRSGKDWYYSCLTKPESEASLKGYKGGCYNSTAIGFKPDMPSFTVCLCRKSHCDPRYHDVEPPRTTVSSGCDERSMTTKGGMTIDKMIVILLMIAAAKMMKMMPMMRK